MITNTGKSIIAKYMIGQAPAYASYMAFGCGAAPLKTTDTHGDYSDKRSLDFEMFRVPIISRGYITENGVQKIVLTSELPTEERYEISEIGIFSAGANPSASMNDSRTVMSFGTNEIWEYHTETASVGLKNYIEPLNATGNEQSMIDVPDAAFQTNANNPTFSTVQRVLRSERPRFLNNTVLMSGNSSYMSNSLKVVGVSATGTSVTFTTEIEHGLSVGNKISTSEISPSNYNLSDVVLTAVTPTSLTISSTEIGAYVSGGLVTLPTPVVISGNHIHLSSTGTSFNKNSPQDELKLAFSIMNKDGVSESNPDRVSVMVEFSSSDSTTSGEHSRFGTTLALGSRNIPAGTYDFDSNRYVVVTKTLESLQKTSAFNWSNIQIIKIYSSVLDSYAISNKALTSNVATLTTATAHGFSIGSRVVVAGVDSTFDGIHTISDVTATSFSYSLTATDVPSQAGSGIAQSSTSNYYVSLDAMRLENVSTYNPLYGMTGYTVVQNTEGSTVLKDLNTANLSEFRFGLNVSGVI